VRRLAHLATDRRAPEVSLTFVHRQRRKAAMTNRRTLTIAAIGLVLSVTTVHGQGRSRCRDCQLGSDLPFKLAQREARLANKAAFRP
jgi:hypothetical protein